MSTDAQIAANQANAQLSTGPTTPEGKAISSQNAFKFGIFAQTLVFPDEDPAALDALRADHLASLKPDGPIESELVETIVRSVWFGRRCDRLEPVIAKTLMDPSKSPTEALAAVFANPRNNPLHQIHRRRQAHQRDWFRALKELQRLQKQRQTADQPVEAGHEVPDKPGTAPLSPPKNGFVFAPGPKPVDPTPSTAAQATSRDPRTQHSALRTQH